MPRSFARCHPILVALEGRATPALFAAGQSFPALGTDAGGQYALTDLVAGDFTNDGAADAVAVNSRTGTFQVFLNNGSGQFTAGPALTSTAASGVPTTAVAADFTGDGKLDLATMYQDQTPGGSAGDAVVVWLGNGDGTFTEAPPGPGGVLRLDAFAAAAADFNADGKRDLVLVSPDGVTGFGLGGYAVLLGTGDGTFAPVADAAAPQFAGNTGAFAADFDADGKVDFASADSPTGGGAQVVFGSGTGTAAQVVTLPAPAGLAGGGKVASAAAADFTGDGEPDLLVAYQNGEVYLFANAGGRTFAGPVLKHTGSGTAFDLAAGDFNQDGVADVALAELNAELTGGQAVVLVNNGTGTFTPADGSPFPTDGGPYKAVAAEFTRDANPDVLVGNFGTDTLQLLRNTTPRPTTVTVTASPTVSEEGQPVTFTATVATTTGTPATPTGTVTFTLGATVLGTVAVGAGGQAVLLTANLPVGSGSVVASFASPDPFLASSSAPVAVQVNPPVAATLVVVFPSPTVAGATGPLTVTVVSVYNRVVTGYAGTVTFASSDPRARLPADYTFTPANAGTATLTAGFRTVGTQYLTVRGAANSGLVGMASGIVVTPGFGLTSQFAAGADRGGGTAALLNPDGSVRFTVSPFVGFTGGVRVAAADFTGDGVVDLVVGSGPGMTTLVRVLDGVTQEELFAVQPFEASFTGGVYVAAGDLGGDGVPDLVVTPDEGGGPRVRVFSGSGFSQMADFFGIDDPNFRGGARAAVGDLTGFGVGDLVVSAGFGGGPRVAGFLGKSLGLPSGPVKLFADFLAFEPTLRNGAYVAAGDLDGDGLAELIAGGGPGGAPRVTAFAGAALFGNQQTVLADFFAGDVNNRDGIRLAAKDLDGDATADLVTAPGTGGRVAAYLGKDLGTAGGPQAFDVEAFPGFRGGVFVG